MMELQVVVSIIVATAACLFVLDIVLKVAVPGFGEKSARWYALHALTNTIVSVLVWPDVVSTFFDPLESLSGNYSGDAPLAMTVGLHVFHCASSYKELTIVDWMHHFISNMLVSGLCFPFDYGPLLGWGIFFICGFPGGLDYYMLAAVKLGWMSSQKEKQINRFINVWIRAPGIVCYLPITMACLKAGKTRVPTPVLICQIFLNLGNGNYFMDRVTGNSAVVDWCEKHGIDKKQAEKKSREEKRERKAK